MNFTNSEDYKIEAIADYLLAQIPDGWGIAKTGVDAEEEVEAIVWNSTEEHGEYLFINQGCAGCFTNEERLLLAQVCMV